MMTLETPSNCAPDTSCGSCQHSIGRSAIPTHAYAHGFTTLTTLTPVTMSVSMSV